MGEKKKKTQKSSYPRRLLSVPELGHIIGLRPQTIYNKINQGLFPIRHKKIGRLVRFDTNDIDEYLDSLPNHR